MARLIISAVMIGMAMGLGLYTYHYGKGYSYLMNDPEACANCHIMQDQYDQWSHSSHKAVATCNDCHVPHSFPAKWVSKGVNGFKHGWAFSTGLFQEPIRIKSRNAKILQESCLYCHGEFVSNLHPKGWGKREDSIACVQCHKSVGHGGR